MSAADKWRGFVRNQKYAWAALYLAAIPVFGFIYSRMDRQFYATNMRLEQGYSVDGKRVAETMCLLFNSYKIRYLSFTALELSEMLAKGDDRAKIAKANVTCDGPVTVASTGSAPTLSVRASWPDAISFKELKIHFPRLAITVLSKQSASIGLYDRVLDITQKQDDSGAFIDGAGLPQREIIGFAIGDGTTVIPALDQLSRFADGDSGFTSDVSDNLQRMVYFSAVTITTLGYGDIVPITTEARWFVTAEAVFGVVMIGLFLNSLTR